MKPPFSMWRYAIAAGWAMELHLRVPADRWCVTFNEFFHFVEDVRTAWLAGQILQRDTFGMLLLGPFRAKRNDLARIGPSISQRNVCFFLDPGWNLLTGKIITHDISCEGAPCLGKTMRYHAVFFRFVCFKMSSAPEPHRTLFQSEESSPDPLHECSCHGPNLYQVNEYFGSAKARGRRFHGVKVYAQGNFPFDFGCFSGLTTWKVVSDIEASFTPFRLLWMLKMLKAWINQHFNTDLIGDVPGIL